MNHSNAASMIRFRRILGIGFAALLCLAVVVTAACGSDPTATPAPTPIPPTAAPAPTLAPPTSTPQPQTSADSDSDEGGHEDKDGDSDGPEAHSNGDSDRDGASSGQSSASSSEDKTDSDSGSSDHAGSDSDGAVSRENPGGEGSLFDNSRNIALFGVKPLNAVTWTVEPVITPGELVAEGMLEQGLVIFNPMVDGEGSGFSVFYKGHEESLVELLPDLGPMFVWDTFQTVAPTEMEIEGPSFKIRAYSPLFMDVGPGDLELRVYGYDQSGADALLAIQDVKVE